jgi:PAS domain S-box-containing protein
MWRNRLPDFLISGSAFRNLPIKRKLLFIMMATTTVSMAVAGAGIVLSDAFLFRGYMQRDLTALARIIADNSTAAISFDDPDSASETLASLRTRPHLVAACIYREEGGGALFAHYFRPGAPAVCSPPFRQSETRLTNDGLALSLPVILENRRIGTLTLLYDLGEIGERRRLYGGTVLGVLLVSGLIALLLASWLRAVIATPVSQLVRVSAAVSKTRDYSIRASKVSEDELGALVDAFNEMLTGIQFRDSELRKALDAREQALTEARNARDSLKTTLASIGDAVISTDLKGCVVFSNRVAQSILRCPESEMPHKHLDDVFRIMNEVTRENIESPATSALRENRETGSAAQVVLVTRDGIEIPIDYVSAPVRGDNGVIHGTVVVFRDVSSRRRSEETSHLLASIVESSGDAIIGHDLNGNLTTWNKGAESIFGYTAAEMIGSPSSVLTAPGCVDEIPEILASIAKGERIGQYQSLRRTKNGAVIDVSITVSPLHDASGRITGASKIARDITSQVRAADRLARLNADLKRSNENLARSNEDLERFAFVASHDLQEPLRMISIYSQLLVREFAGSAGIDAPVFVSNIVEGTARMRELLTDLRTYTEVGAMSDDTEQGTVDLNVALEKVRHNLKAAIDENNASITSDPLPTLVAHEAHFVSLFQNLIGNAIKYRSQQTPEVCIAVTRSDGFFRFAVTDNGMGIDSPYQDSIFMAFKRLHGKNIPGTGIGLAICQRVVERYGGRIRVQSDLGHGSTFFFDLPQSLASQPTDPKAASAQVAGAPQPPVDNNETN